MLSSWGVSFEGVDVEADPSALADLARLGIPLVPATVVDDRFVHGWNPRALAELVGVTHVEGARLEPPELARRLDRVLAVNQVLIRQLPPERLGMTYPGRDRTVLQLAFHVFRLSAAYADAREQGFLPETWLGELAPASMRDGEAVARHGQGVRERLRAFCGRPGWCEGTVRTYYGDQPAHELMERTTWHAAQHVRQVQWFVEQAGLVPADRLSADDLQGLPHPRDVWS